MYGFTDVRMRPSSTAYPTICRCCCITKTALYSDPSTLYSYTRPSRLRHRTTTPPTASVIYHMHTILRIIASANVLSGLYISLV